SCSSAGRHRPLWFPVVLLSLASSIADRCLESLLTAVLPLRSAQNDLLYSHSLANTRDGSAYYRYVIGTPTRWRGPTGRPSPRFDQHCQETIDAGCPARSRP